MSKSFVKNASDRSQVKDSERKVKSRDMRHENNMRYVLAEYRGREFIWDLLSHCGVFRSSFTGNSETFFNEGKREIGLKLMSDIIKADVDAYPLMMKENKEREDLNV